MQFFTDDHFSIGAAHLGAGLPCQDYALSGVKDTMAYAIVSDGCSTGGRTDVGARIIAHTAEVSIRDHWRRCSDPLRENSRLHIGMQQEVLLQQARLNLGLVQNDLLATCAYAYFSHRGGFVNVRGDAVVVVARRDGVMSFTKYSWANNMPLYPAYFADDYASFARAHGGAGALAFEEDVWVYRPDEGWQTRGITKYSVGHGIKGCSTVFPIGFQTETAFVALMSDGATQVDGIDWKEAALSLMSFKGVEGSFAKRRMNGFIKNAQKKGKGPFDDIAYAVIRIASEENDDGST